MEKKEKIINEILEREWVFFQMADNKGGRAECQDNREEFVIMRKSQWKTFNMDILESYLEDLKTAEKNRHNIVVEKYARMMEYTVPEEYEAIKNLIPELSISKKELGNKIVDIYMNWEREAQDKYPKIMSQGRPLYSKDDSPHSVSIETYLRGELYSYSEKTLNLYYQYVKSCLDKSRNLAIENIESIAFEKGFSSLKDLEEKIK